MIHFRNLSGPCNDSIPLLYKEQALKQPLSTVVITNLLQPVMNCDRFPKGSFLATCLLITSSPLSLPDILNIILESPLQACASSQASPLIPLDFRIITWALTPMAQFHFAMTLAGTFLLFSAGFCQVLKMPIRTPGKKKKNLQMIYVLFQTFAFSNSFCFSLIMTVIHAYSRNFKNLNFKLNHVE